MYWENKLYIFTISYIVGILIIFGNHHLFPVNIVLIITGLVFIGSIILGYLSYKKSGYIKPLIVFLFFYLFPLLLGITLTLNSFNTSKKGHLLYITKGAKSVKATVYGYIYREPEYYENKVKIFIKPITISFNNSKYKVKYGKILLHYSFEHGQFPNFLTYGHYITFSGTLERPPLEQNPGGFNYRKFLESKGVYYTIFFRNMNNIIPHEKTKKNPLFSFSLNLKHKFLHAIRRTVRFPESAFLGGVTLGLRYGLDGIRITKNAKYQIKDDFKRAGVNHVLAVSGLHVTIITLFFIAIFSLFGISRRIYPIITVFFLIIFAIITGGRPSTLRAVIMNGFILIFWAFSKKGIKGSTELGITWAALLILLFNPLLLREASFTLSFGAVLSLVLITPFIDDLLKRYLIGYTFWAALLIFILFPILLIMFKERFFNSPFLWVFFILSGILLYFANKLEVKTKLPYPQYRKLPSWLISFISAQFAIQLGMMLPLSSYYFGRYPIAGMFANYIAIPLIGLNVQIGLIAAIFSLIPVVGIYIALVLNAGNYLFLKFFLYMAHWFSVNFPYPYVKKMNFLHIVYYFFILLLIINYSWLKEKYFDYKYYVKLFKQNHNKRLKWLKAFPITLIILFLLFSLYVFIPKNQKHHLDITFYSLSQGNVIFIKTPKGKNILINSGKYTRYKRKEWDEADKVIMTTLMHYGINHLDMVVATDYSMDNFSAFSTIIDDFPVYKTYFPTNIGNIAHMTYENMVLSTKNNYLINHMNAYWVKSYYNSAIRVIKIINKHKIPYYVVKTGDYIYKERLKVGNIIKYLEIYVLNPPKKKNEDYLDDNLVIKIDYVEKKDNFVIFKKQFLINGALDESETQNLLPLKKYYSDVDVFLAPNRFLYNDALYNILKIAKPIDFLFHLNYFKYNRDFNLLQRNYDFLKKYGTNFFNISNGYVRYIISNHKLYRFTQQNGLNMELPDYTDEY